MNPAHKTVIQWHPFPEMKPPHEGTYLAGHGRSMMYYWIDGMWKNSPFDERLNRYDDLVLALALAFYLFSFLYAAYMAIGADFFNRGLIDHPWPHLQRF